MKYLVVPRDTTSRGLLQLHFRSASEIFGKRELSIAGGSNCFPNRSLPTAICPLVDRFVRGAKLAG